MDGAVVAQHALKSASGVRLLVQAANQITVLVPELDNLILDRPNQLDQIPGKR